LRESYQAQGFIEIAGAKVPLSAIHESAVFKAHPTKAAWERIKDHDRYMSELGRDSNQRDLVAPMFQRMGMSALKLGVLLAASRQEPSEQAFTVGEQDIINGAHYIQKWSRYSIDLMVNAGGGDFQKQMARVRQFIAANPGCQKAALLRYMNKPTKVVTELLINLV